MVNLQSESSVILRVDHKPIFGARFRRKASPGLAVGISSVNVTSNGISWLQHMLREQNVQFLLLKRVENQVNCIVYHQVTIVIVFQTIPKFVILGNYDLICENIAYPSWIIFSLPLFPDFEIEKIDLKKYFLPIR